MSSIARRRNAGKDAWVARYRDPSGRERKRSFVRKIDAQRFLTGVDDSKMRGAYVDPATGRVTVEAWAATWIQAQSHLKPSTRARYKGILVRHILPRWGPVALQSVSHAEVATWVAQLSTGGLAGASVRYVHRVFSMMLELAVRDGRIIRNPAANVPLPRAAKPDKRFLTHDQVGALARAAGKHRLVILTLAYTGLRWGEMAGLRVGHVDLMRRRIDVVEAVTEVDGVLVRGTPKGHQRRSVPVPRFLAEELSVHIAGKPREAQVFTTSRGAVLRNLNFRRDVFDAAAHAAGLDGLTPHELRHTAASLAVSAGANVKAVQRMLGHASAAMTLDVYSGLFDDDLDAVAERLSDAASFSDVPVLRPPATVTSITERHSAR